MLKFYNSVLIIVVVVLALISLLPGQVAHADKREVKEFDGHYCDPAIPPPKNAAEAEARGPNCQGTKLGSSDAGLVGKYGIPILNFLGAIVGLIVTISVVAGGIQYAISANDPAALAAARSRVRNAVIALVAFLFLYGFLQWLVPGGFV